MNDLNIFVLLDFCLMFLIFVSFQICRFWFVSVREYLTAHQGRLIFKMQVFGSKLKNLASWSEASAQLQKAILKDYQESLELQTLVQDFETENSTRGTMRRGGRSELNKGKN